MATNERSTVEKIAKEVENLWEENLDGFLGDDHGIEIKLLLEKFGKFKKGEANVDDLIFESESVRNRTWELLNVGKWSNLSEERKQVYAIASFVQVVALLRGEKPNAIEKCLEIADLGILLGSPFRSIFLTKVADILSGSVSENVAPEPFANGNPSGSNVEFPDEIDCVRRPSLERFCNDYFGRKRPVKLTGCIDHWPALRLWQDFRYIVKKAGCRIVPVELGKHYAHEGYHQKLMKISDFVKDFFGGNETDEIGYLAQHQLFDQVPELKKDIMEPDYCALTSNPDGPEGTTEINAWFGPKGTVSPLHFDPKHNFLCQVVGSKKIILHPESDTDRLYPHEGSLLFNTSRVDVENPDFESFPEYAKTNPKQCVIRSGEILYIPPRYWHHVRSLENSFSVSFWWD